MKKKAKVKRHKKEHVFMRVDSPKVLEKKILTSAVMATQLLKNYEAFSTMREKRIKKMNGLRRSIVGIHKEVVSFKRKFPRIGEEDEVLEEEPRINLKNMNDLDKDLYLIEKRLKEI